MRRVPATLIVVTLLCAVLHATTQNFSPITDVADLWVASAGTDLWDLVNDPVGTPDDDTTYIEAGTAQDSVFQHFTITVPSLPAGSTINSVTINGRAKRTGADGDFQIGITVAASSFMGATESPTGSYGNFSKVYNTNPSSTAAWTQAQIEGTAGAHDFNADIIIVAFGMTGANKVRCTQMWLVIDYTAPASTGPPVGSLMLLGVGR